MKKLFLLILFLIITSTVSGCNNGGSDDSGPSGTAATLAISMPASTATVTVPVTYTISGTGAWDVSFRFSTDGGTTWNGAAPAAGCATTKKRPAAGAGYTYLWDRIADGVTGTATVLMRGSISGSFSTASGTVENMDLTYLNLSATVSAATTTYTFSTAHRGHYDLSPITLNYLGDQAFVPLVKQIPVKSWRISVGRWEIGPASVLAPEPDCYSSVTTSLQNCSREFYRGPNTIAGAKDPNNYYFGYFDAAILAIVAAGAEPYLSFDYMPITLATTTNPSNPDNLYQPGNDLSFSNGIRTSPPKDPAVYAEVVKNVVTHVTGTFANGLNLPLTYVEIGNEPDLADGTGTPVKYFWTGTQSDFFTMYQSCVTALNTQFGNTIKIGAGSFAWLSSAETFANNFMLNVKNNATRLDFLSFHIYSDTPETDFVNRLSAIKALRDANKPAAELHCTEWGMALTGGSKFDDMTAALHHAKVLEYFELPPFPMFFDVKLSHRALIRDPVADTGHMGLLKTGPLANKPAAYVFHAYEMLSQTPTFLFFTAIDPPDTPMLVAGRSDTAITLIFFHEAPSGQAGRMALTVDNVPFANYQVDRYVLTDATSAIGDGLWLVRSYDESDTTFSETLTFTSDTLVVWRLTKK